MVENKRTLENRTSVEKRYYISSFEASAENLTVLQGRTGELKTHSIGF